VAEMAETLRVSRSTVYRAISSGVISAFRIGSRLRVSKATLVRILDTGRGDKRQLQLIAKRRAEIAAVEYARVFEQRTAEYRRLIREAAKKAEATR
jgi:excisionase family DNA binding protein